MVWFAEEYCCSPTHSRLPTLAILQFINLLKHFIHNGILALCTLYNCSLTRLVNEHNIYSFDPPVPFCTCSQVSVETGEFYKTHVDNALTSLNDLFS